MVLDFEDTEARRLNAAYGGSWSDPLVQDFYRALVCREEFLSTKYGRGRAATGTRRLLRNRGGDIVQCVEQMTLRAGETPVFAEMVAAGLFEGTADYVVAKHRDRFSNAVVARVHGRMVSNEISI